MGHPGVRRPPRSLDSRVGCERVRGAPNRQVPGAFQQAPARVTFVDIDTQPLRPGGQGFEQVQGDFVAVGVGPGAQVKPFISPVQAQVMAGQAHLFGKPQAHLVLVAKLPEFTRAGVFEYGLDQRVGSSGNLALKRLSRRLPVVSLWA